MTLPTKEAVARALLLHKARPSAGVAATVAEVIPVLVLALDSEDEHDQELLALAEAWLADPTCLGRRVRDLAVELARRVAQIQGISFQG
jgi:hypothetical protein